MTEPAGRPEVADDRVAAALARLDGTPDPADRVVALQALAEDLQAILGGRDDRARPQQP